MFKRIDKSEANTETFSIKADVVTWKASETEFNPRQNVRQKRGFVQVIAERLSLVFLRVAHPETCTLSLNSMRVLVLIPVKKEDMPGYPQASLEVPRTTPVLLSWY